MAAMTGFTMIQEKLPATAFVINTNTINRSAKRLTKAKEQRLFT